MNAKFSVMASALGDDPREAIARSREIGFGGVVFDAMSRGLDLTELSQSGRREFRHILASHAQTLVAVRVQLLPHGFTQSADIERILGAIDKTAQAARDLQATCIALDLGPLPAPDSAITALAELTERYGVSFALFSSLAGYESLSKVLTLAKCPWFAVEIDPVAVLADTWSATEIFSQLAPAIVHVRARDALVGENNRIKPMEIGTGSVRWLEFLATLDSAGYRGWITIDPTDLPDRAGAAMRGLKSLRLPR